MIPDRRLLGWPWLRPMCEWVWQENTHVNETENFSNDYTMDVIPRNVLNFEVGIMPMNMQLSNSSVIIVSIISSLIHSIGRNERISPKKNKWTLTSLSIVFRK